jgi:hypothetical protein
LSGSLRRKALPLVLLIALLLSCGCAATKHPKPVTYVVLPAPPPDEVRRNLGVVTIVSSDLEGVTVARPASKGEAAGRSATEGGVGMLEMGLESADPFGLAVGIILSPVAAVGGGVYGACVGMSDRTFKEHVAVLERVAHESDLPGRLEDGCKEATRRLAPQHALEPTEVRRGRQEARLEISPEGVVLRGGKDINPPMTLNCVVRVRLLRSGDDAELFSGRFSHVRTGCTLREWTEDDGAALRAAIADACNALAEQIVERVFLVYEPIVGFAEGGSTP